MNVALLKKDGNILLPQAVVKKLSHGNRFVVVEDKGTLVLKPLKKVDIISLPSRIKTGKAMTLAQISEEVHAQRKRKRVSSGKK